MLGAVLGARGGQKRALNVLDLAVVSCYVGILRTKCRSSVTAASTFKG